MARIRNPKRRQLDNLRPIENPPTDGIPNTTHSRCTSRDVTQIEDPRRKLPQLAQEKQTMYLDLFPRNCDGEVITLVISSIEVIYLQ